MKALTLPNVVNARSQNPYGLKIFSFMLLLAGLGIVAWTIKGPVDSRAPSGPQKEEMVTFNVSSTSDLVCRVDSKMLQLIMGAGTVQTLKIQINSHAPWQLFMSIGSVHGSKGIEALRALGVGYRVNGGSLRTFFKETELVASGHTKNNVTMNLELMKESAAKTNRDRQNRDYQLSFTVVGIY